MKKKNLLRNVMLISASLWIWLAKATTVTVVYNYDSGIDNARYTATLEDGTILGFSDYSSEGATFCGAITTARSLVIPDSIMYGNDVYEVTYAGNRYSSSCDFSQSPNLTSIEMPSVKYVNNYAFQNNTSLKSLSLPAATSIGSSAFYGCSSLNDLSIPLATSISYGAFYNCSSLKNLTLSVKLNIDRYTFEGLYSKIDLYLVGDTIATWDPSRLPSNTNIVWVPQMFYNNYKSWTTQYGIDVRYEGWKPKTIIVSTTETRQLSKKILEEVDQWSDIDALIVSGQLDDSDMKNFSLMSCLRELDLSNTDISYISGCGGLKLLSKIKLPTTVIEIDDNAFAGCTHLDSISLPNVTLIGENAFGDCYSLSSIETPKVTSIGYKAFYYCSDLVSISCPLVQEVGMKAFEGCSSLINIDFPSAITIGDRAFSYCVNLKSVSLPFASEISFRAFEEDANLENVSLPSATSIGSYSFSKCRKLANLELPSVISVGGYAFDGCEMLSSISLPESLSSIGSNCFANCSSLSDVYCQVALPFATSAFANTSTIGRAILHVPTFGINAYQTNTDWNVFKTIVGLDGEVRKVMVSSDITIINTTGLAEKSEWNLGYAQNRDLGGHLTIDATSSLNIGKFVQDIDFSNMNDLSTMIIKNEMTADSTIVFMTIPTDSWQFFSLPFDVNVKSIQVAKNVLWVIRRYSGEDRAALTGNTWQDVPSESVLQAGEGYIIQCTKEDGALGDVRFGFPAVNNEKKNGIFAYGDILKSLNQYESEYAYNRSWNLVGNPYPAYMDATKITHNGVITTWNGNGYTAYSLKDDQYVLRPFEAFFVQRADDAEAMTFGAEGRQHTKDVANNSPRLAPKRAQNNRQVFNFTLADNSYTDRTRLVINPEAKADYETSCDAAKMLSMNSQTPQLYIVDNSVRYAIDERPVGNGEFLLGMRTNSKGTYTIALQDMAESNTTVVLTDHLTGRETDLTMESYSFTAEGGTTDNRFSITLGGDITGISQIENGKSRIENVFTLDGKQVTSASQPGIYIVSKGGKNRKVVVTK